MKTWEATVRVPNGSGSSYQNVKTRVQTSDYNQAKMLLEAQYGRGSISTNPREVK